MGSEKITTGCCIAGGGPAGIMLGYLLARAGIGVTVLEKWPDFFRDFRGDTIHPSTMQILQEVGLLQDFLKLPHSKTYQLEANIGADKVVIADFSRLKVLCPFIAFIPQWDFLNFMVEQAKQYPTFKILMNTAATELIIDQGKVTGVHACELEIKADLVVAADGRHSVLREQSGLVEKVLSAPMDVLWFRLSRHATDPKQSLGRVDLGRIMVMIERNDYWQCGFLIRKGQFEAIKKAGLDTFRHNIVEIAPSLVDRVNEITSWDQVKLLEVTVNRLEKWYLPGFLCIGDAAHAMSPLGGVGINLAIADAVAAANVLIPAFKRGAINEADLVAIQKRRQFPTKVIQRIQVFIQNNVIDRVLGNRTRPQVPFIFKLLQRFPSLQRIPAYLVGVGFRPEHVKS